jgi:hypothetical protein
MKEYVDVTHISTNFSKGFQSDLNKVIKGYQNNGYGVEVQHAFNGNVFSAVVLAYKKGDK